jgi:hypothetical protein
MATGEAMALLERVARYEVVIQEKCGQRVLAAFITERAARTYLAAYRQGLTYSEGALVSMRHVDPGKQD